jgi:hypothetical protein
MSFSVDIVGYKDKAEGNKLIDAADAILAKRIELNRGNAIAIDSYYSRKKLNIPPIMPQTRTAEEEIQDTSLQRAKALASLKSFMKENDALAAMNWLSANNEIVEFNRYANIFMKEIAGQTNITPTYFETLWDRYKAKLISTGRTGIAITTEPGEYKADIANIESLIISSGPTIAQRIDYMRKDAAYLAGLDQKALDAELDKIYTKETGDPINTTNKPPFSIIEIPLGSGKKVDDYTVRFSSSESAFVLNKTSNKKTNWNIANDKKIQYILFKMYGVPIGMKIEWTGDPSTVVIPAATIGVSAPAGTASAVRPAIVGAPVSGTGRKLSIPSSGKGINHFAIYGAGLGADIVESVKPEELAIDKHVNKREALVPNQKNFGNYALSLNALKKGFLCIRYPSGAYISGFPRTMISSRLRKILNDIVFEDKFLEEDYRDLDEAEQKLFDDLITFCKMDKKDSVKLYKHKKYSDKDRDEMIKRFNILKGELLAGNDNPNIVKELKVLVLKMYHEKVISKTEMNKIMYHLCITV